MTAREGELLFQKTMENKGYTVEDVSQNGNYFDKDIDFLVTSPTSGLTKSFEVKTDSRIAKTGNLYLETINMHSAQWNYYGWWEFCKADYLVYIDAQNGKQYIFSLLELKERVAQLPKQIGQCGQDSFGFLVSLNSVRDLAREI